MSRCHGVRISQPPVVTAMVCSYWAESRLSAVTTVQLSSRNRISAVPSLIIGSMVRGMPSRKRMPRPRRPTWFMWGSSCSSCPMPWPPSSRTTRLTMVLRELLDGRSDVTEAFPGSHLGDPSFQAFPGDVQEFSGPWRDVAHRVHVASVADPTPQCGSDVYAHDVSISQPPRPRNAVDDLLIDRGTNGAGEWWHRG